MGRLAKPGIPYYYVESDHTRNKKILLLVNEAGGDGYWIWSCLIDEIYHVHGYYFDTSNQEEFEFFCLERCKRPLEVVLHVIDICLRRNLFSSEVYERTRCLTGKTIQLSYLLSTSERRRKGTKVYFRRDLLSLENCSAEELKQVQDHHINNAVFEDETPIFGTQGGGKKGLAAHPPKTPQTPSSAPQSDCSAEESGSSAEAPRQNEIAPRQSTHSIVEYSIDKRDSKLSLVGTASDAAEKKEDGEDPLTQPPPPPVVPEAIPPTPLPKAGKTKGKTKPKAPDAECFHRMKTVYTTWYKQTEGRPPLWQFGKCDAALKNLVLYFRTIALDELGQLAAEDTVSERAVEAFSTMLFDWGKITDNFLRRTDIMNISSQAGNILSNQKTATRNGNKHQSAAGPVSQKLGTSDARVDALPKWGLSAQFAESTR